MSEPSFSARLDQMIQDILDRKRLREKQMRVVMTGHDHRTLVMSLRCLEGLYQAGYGLSLAFSCSARHSIVETVCRRWATVKQLNVEFDSASPAVDTPAYYGVFLPALSTNSLAKMAMCLQDNLACEWAFDALYRHKPVVATLNSDYLTMGNQTPLALRKKLVQYVDTLETYGVQFSGRPVSRQNASQRIITVKEVREHDPSTPLLVDRDTFITPAAKDEITRLNLVVENLN